MFFGVAAGIVAGQGLDAVTAGTAKAPQTAIYRSWSDSVTIPSIPVTTLDGTSVDIARLPGWRVVYFWSAECPCVTACENFTLRGLAKQYAGTVTFCGVVSGGFDLARPVVDLRQSIARRNLPYSGYWKQLTQTGKNDTWKMVRR